jgi:hypothetical protein
VPWRRPLSNWTKSSLGLLTGMAKLLFGDLSYVG